MTVVFWQRYPEDPVSSRSFESDGMAEQFVREKSEDYRYTVGRVWAKKYIEAATPAKETNK